MEIIKILCTEGYIYLILFFYLWCNVILESSIQTSQYKNYFFIISSTILALFIGVRWETGTDWTPYKDLFDTLQLDWSFLFNIYHFDIGYVLFNAFIKLFTENYTIFLICNSSITIFLLSKLIIKISPYPNLSLLFFYTNFMIAQFMGSNRRMMAMVFILWFFYYIYTKKKTIIFKFRNFISFSSLCDSHYFQLLYTQKGFFITTNNYYTSYFLYYRYITDSSTLH